MLHRACAHCGRFLAAATRRCLGRFSVPVWLIILTDQQPVNGLVGHYPANNLMGRTPLRPRLAAFLDCSSVRGISTRFRALFPTVGQVRTCSSAVRHCTPERVPCDLHALGTPPALILSQDQTRQNSGEAGTSGTVRTSGTGVWAVAASHDHTSVGKVQSAIPAKQKRERTSKMLHASRLRCDGSGCLVRANRPAVSVSIP